MEPVEAAGIATTAFSTVFVILRVFTKLRVANERLGPADCKSTTTSNFSLVWYNLDTDDTSFRFECGRSDINMDICHHDISM